MTEERVPAENLLHDPHEVGDGFLRADDVRVNHLRYALQLIQDGSVDREHARVLAYTALRLDAGGAKGVKGHLHSFIEGAGSLTARRLRRFLEAKETPQVTRVGHLVRDHVEKKVYEGIVGRVALDELEEVLPNESPARSRESLRVYLVKWKKQTLLHTEILCDVCEALIQEGEFQLPPPDPLPPL